RTTASRTRALESMRLRALRSDTQRRPSQTTLRLRINPGLTPRISAMTTRRRSPRRLHSRHVFSAMGFLGLLVSASAWAHQAGLINWQLPDSLAKSPYVVSRTHITHPTGSV